MVRKDSDGRFIDCFFLEAPKWSELVLVKYEPFATRNKIIFNVRRKCDEAVSCTGDLREFYHPANRDAVKKYFKKIKYGGTLEEYLENVKKDNPCGTFPIRSLTEGELFANDYKKASWRPKSKE